MALASHRNNWTHAHGTPTTWRCIASGKSSTCAMGTVCVKHTSFVWMLWSIRSASTPMISSPLPLRRWKGKPSNRYGPTFAYTGQIFTMCRHTKNMYFESIYQKTPKKLKNGFGIHYLCHHMPLLVAGACPYLHGSLSLHKGSHLWQWFISTTMQRSLLGRG